MIDRQLGDRRRGRLVKLGEEQPGPVDQHAPVPDPPDENRLALLDPDGNGIGQAERDFGGGNRRDLAEARLERLRRDVEQVHALRQSRAAPGSPRPG